MARQKRVYFVSVTEHERIMARMRAEVAAWKAVAENCTGDVDDLRKQVEEMMEQARRALRSRRKLRQHSNLALAACGRPGCTTLIMKAFDKVGGPYRRCAKCAAEEKAAFVAAREAIMNEEPTSPTTFLATD